MTTTQAKQAKLPTGQVVVKPNTKLAQSIRAYVTASTLEKLNKDRKERLQASIRASLPNRATRSMVLPDGSILLTDNLQDGKPCVDLDALRSRFPDAFKACVSTGASFRVMRAKPACALLRK